MKLEKQYRVRLLWEITRIGDLIAAPQIEYQEYTDGNAYARVEYAWWYRPVVAFGFWLVSL